jgi:arginine decarboxylase
LFSTQSINDILIDLDYDIDKIHRKLKNLIDNQNLKEEEKKELLGKLLIHLNDTVYLKK